MAVEHFNLDRLSDIRPRPAPRCYSRQPIAHAIRQSRVEADASAVVIALSIITCIVGFLVIPGGWSF